MKGDVIGFDIGGTNMRSVLMRNKKVVAMYTTKTPRSRGALARAIGVFLDEFERNDKAKVSHMGLGIAGVHDVKRGVVISSPNIGFLKHTSIRGLVRRRAVSVRNDNDVRCFLRAEIFSGAAKNKKSAVALTLGTGVGGAVWMNGAVVQGSTDSAGEFGHMTVGNNQTLEALASEKFFKRHGVQSPKAFAQQAYKGNARARALYKEFGKNVGIGCANIINAFNPDIIVLGGGISRDAKLFLPSMREIIALGVISPRARKTPIVVSSLGEYAGAIGAALLF